MRIEARVATALLAAASSAGALVLLLLSVWRSAGSGLTTLDGAIGLLVQAAGVAVLLWYLVTALAAACCLALRAAGRARATTERRLAAMGAPLLRRLLIVGTGALVTSAAILGPASATPTSDPTPALGDDLGWGAQDASQDASQDPTESPTESPTAAERSGHPEREHLEDDPATAIPASASDAEPEPTTYTVVGGDSLWAIAADHLRTDADNADIAAAWPRWFDANHEVIGENPDLIYPGQVLVVPDHELEEKA